MKTGITRLNQLQVVVALLAFGLLAGPAGDYGFTAIRTAPHTPYVAALVLGSETQKVLTHSKLPVLVVR